MYCKRCGEEMVVQTASQTKRRGCFTILIYIVLLFIPIIGWFSLFAMLRGSSKKKAVSFAICPNCGYKRTL